MGIKNPTDPLHYFFSCVNNKVEIHLKYRLATTLAKSKFNILNAFNIHHILNMPNILNRAECRGNDRLILLFLPH